MSAAWRGVLLLSAIVLVACAPVSGSRSPESLITAFDPKEWVVGHQAETSNQRIVEFVHPGQKVTSWTELLTMHPGAVRRQDHPVNAAPAAPGVGPGCVDC